MASSGDPELSGGFSIAQWMKAKPSDAKREFEPFAASPPPHDDSFFYIRYPKADTLFPAAAGASKAAETTLLVQDPQASASAVQSREVDWTKHTKPCQDVLRTFAPINTTANLVTVKPKPAGTDDGFKGEGAACGSSVLKVAHKMVSSRTVSQRGFTVATPADDDLEATPPTPGAGAYNLAARRGSRSLPASPLHSPPGSPTARRKNRNANRFFTSPFEPSDATNSRSWLTAALLGYKKEMEASTSTLAEEDIHSRLQGNSLMASVESLGPAPRAAAEQAGRAGKLPQSDLQPTQEPKLTKPAAAFRPKPTEFREMNFWSPTSM